MPLQKGAMRTLEEHNMDNVLERDMDFMYQLVITRNYYLFYCQFLNHCSLFVVHKVFNWYLSELCGWWLFTKQ